MSEVEVELQVHEDGVDFALGNRPLNRSKYIHNKTLEDNVSSTVTAPSARATVLLEDHIRLNAKMVDFAGWNMPVEYEGLRAEHLNTRAHVGLFDVSHMGEIRVRGEKSLQVLQWLTSNDVSKLQAGQAQYSLLPNDRGGLVDDVIVYCLEPGRDYLVCVNAANTEKDWLWMNAHNVGAEMVNESGLWSQIAVQGPKAMSLVQRIFGREASPSELKSFHFKLLPFSGETCMVARTGYTGEDGVEVFVPNARAIELWRQLLSEGVDLGVKPVGLGARDTLRTEMKFSLYGHEIDDDTNPYAAGLGWVVKPEAKDFIGRGPMMVAKEAGLNERLVGFIMVDRAIARAGYALKSPDGEVIGRVTSGTPSPTLEKNIGIGYLKIPYSGVGQEIRVDVRGRLMSATVVRTPFVTTRKS